MSDQTKTRETCAIKRRIELDNGKKREPKVPDNSVTVTRQQPHELGNPRGFRTLHELFKNEDPNLVFLQETKVKASYFNNKNFNLGFNHGLGVGCKGKSGGMVVLWKEDVDFKILHYYNHDIH